MLIFAELGTDVRGLESGADRPISEWEVSELPTQNEMAQLWICLDNSGN